MFQSVRPNSQIYILHKGNPMRYETGYVTNQPIPKPKYSIPQTFGQPQELIVDLVVKVGDATLNFNGIPANLDIADSYSGGESIVISTSREAMNAEVLSTKQKSIDAINNMDFHKDMVTQCDEILGLLNPEYAEKQTQREELNNMKSQLDILGNKVDRLIDAMLIKQKNYEQDLGNQRKN